MPHVPGPESLAHVTRAQLLLGMSQLELADLLSTSRRTITRWFANESMPSVGQLHALARRVHPLDEALASKLAAEGGETLESLGLVRPPPPPPPAPPPVPPSPPPRAFPPIDLMVESIVCAAADTMKCQPSEVREVLRAAFARARALDLRVEEVDDVMSRRVDAHAAAPGDAGVAAVVARARKSAREKA